MTRGFTAGMADAMLIGQAKRAQSQACAAGYLADDAERKLRRERARADAAEKELIALRLLVQYSAKQR